MSGKEDAGNDDYDDVWRPYVEDRDDPSIQVDKETLKDASSTPKQCVQFVNILQKNHGRRAGREIFSFSIQNFVGYQTSDKLSTMLANNRESEWLKAAETEYNELEYHLKEALKNLDNDNTAPVVEALDAMIEWFMELFIHRRQERWQIGQNQWGKDAMEFWRDYFNVLKNLAIGFGKDPAHFDGFETSSNPFCIQVSYLGLGMEDTPHSPDSYKVQWHGPPLGIAGVKTGSMFVYVGYTGRARTGYTQKLYMDFLYEVGECPPNTILTVTEIEQRVQRMRYHLRGNNWEGWVPVHKLFRLLQNDQLQPIPPESQNRIRPKPSTSAARRHS
jgi:hypothetical protein